MEFEWLRTWVDSKFIDSSLVTPDHVFLTLTTAIVHIFIFVVPNVVLYACHKYRWFEAYLIRPRDQYPSGALLRECIFHMAFTLLVGGPLLVFLSVYPIVNALGGIDMRGPMPEMTTCITHLVVFMICEDTVFYWAHRLFHHKWLYKRIHKFHHRFNNTVGLAAEFANPIEQIFANSLAFYFGPVVLRSHIKLWWIWMIIRIGESIEGHSGYDIVISPWNMLNRLQGCVGKHDFHHSHNIGSYGSLFNFWDWAMGTDRAFKEYQAKTAKSKQQ